MATIREIRKRIKSAQNIQQITKAMKMVSAAKMRKAQEKIFAARPYADKITEVITELSAKAGSEEYPLLKKNDNVSKEAVVLITADKGLCGSFNTNLAKEVMSGMKLNPDVTLYHIGKKGMDLLKKFKREVAKFIFNDKAFSWDDVEDLGKSLIEAYKSGKYKKVDLVYSRFRTNLQQDIVRVQLLPVVFKPSEADTKAAANRDFMYEPGQATVLNSLFDRYVKTSIYRAVLESQASEHGVRMVAMEMATNNSGEMIRDLTLLANKTRQAAITKEILEIVGGAEAVKG